MAKKKFYAVAIGRKPGIYTTWSECETQIKKYSKALYKSFTSKDAAEKFILQNSKSSSNNELNEVPEESDTKKRSSGNTTLKDNEFIRSKKLKISNNPTESNSQNSVQIQNTPSIQMWMNFDGGSRGNNGKRAGAGAVLEIQMPTSREKRKIRKYLDQSDAKGAKLSNNFAEYFGVLIGLREAKTVIEEMEGKKQANKNDKHQISMVVKGDSMVIINQINGSFQCKGANIIQLYKETKALIKEMEKLGFEFKFEHVYRAENTEADALANEAMDTKSTWTTKSTSTCIITV